MLDALKKEGWKIDEIYGVIVLLKDFTLKNGKIRAVGVTPGNIVLYPAPVAEMRYEFYFSTQIRSYLSDEDYAEAIEVQKIMQSQQFQKKYNKKAKRVV